MASRKKTVGIEITDDTPTVEPVSKNVDFKKLAAEESVMNEPMTILIHSTTDENQAPHVVVNCNGVNQPIVRGVPTEIKRKYVEILARMRETKYTQVTPNPSAPDVTEMQARHALAYPFDLVEVKNPKGRSWLDNVLAEPA